MLTVRTNSWTGFERAIKRVRRQYGVYRRELPDGQIYERTNSILFRGQADAKWPLATTLERKSDREFDVLSYMELALRAQNELESVTGQRWSVATYPDLQKEIQERQETFTVHLPAYDFLVYLRHHGYPSPLLDWTESPFIAAYFAYLTSGPANAAVYCYIERPNSVKGGSGGDPMISVRGPFVSTHKRHFAQKAWYTIATRWDYRLEKHYFCPHEKVFSRSDDTQDLLIKISLPASERTEALRTLNDYNINHFTLFQTEDALVKALEFKHFDLRDV